MKNPSKNRYKIEVPKSIGKWCQNVGKEVENGAPRDPKSRQNPCKFRGLKKVETFWKKPSRRHRLWDVLRGQETLLELLNQPTNQPTTNQPTNQPTDYLNGRSNSFLLHCCKRRSKNWSTRLKQLMRQKMKRWYVTERNGSKKSE